jgi:hypothetical protein
MINPTSCYYELKTKAVNVSDMFNTYFNSLRWLPYYSFDASPLPLTAMNDEPILKLLHKEFEIVQMGFLKIDSNRCYNWHTDYSRGVALNMLVTPNVHSYCLFGEPVADNRHQTEFVKLEYKPDTFYVFNTQWSHSVLNFEEPRYLFSVEFAKDKSLLTYEDVKDWAVKNNL